MNLGIVDGDSKEEIKIVANVKREMRTEAGDRIAQLLFPYIKGKVPPIERTVAFVSNGKMCVLANNDQRPKLMVQMNGVAIEGLVNRGAHDSIFLQFY